MTGYTPPGRRIDHRPGCPADPNRVEQYNTTAPKVVERGHYDPADKTGRKFIPARSVTVAYVVTRCQDCGAHAAKPK